MEGGSWDGYTLTQQARQLLEDEPLMSGHVRRDELHSARTVVRAAAMEVLNSRVLLRPTDPERSRAFYRDTLGLAIYRELSALRGTYARRTFTPGI
jgi:hypothetical protein